MAGRMWACAGVCAAGLVAGLSAVRPFHERSVTPGGGSVAAVVAEPTHRALGVVVPGTRTTLEYTLTNTGAARVSVLNVRPSCGCSPASVTTRALEPGGDTRLVVDFTASKRGESAYAVTVETTAGEVTVTFAVIVADPIACDPPRLNFGSVASGVVATRIVQLASSGGDPYDILRVESPPGVTCERRSEAGGRPKHVLDVSLDPDTDSAAGRREAVVRIHTTDLRQPVVELPVEWYVAASRVLTPSSLFLSGQAGAATSAKVLYRFPQATTASVQAAVVRAEASDSRVRVTRVRVSEVRPTGLVIDLAVVLPDTQGYSATTLSLSSPDVGLRETIPVNVYVVGR